MIQQLTVFTVVLGAALGARLSLKEKSESLTAVDSINYLCHNLTEDQIGKPQSLGRCYNRYYVCSNVDGSRVWESFACDDCLKFDEDVGACRPESQINKCNVDADGFDILDIDDVLLACDKIQFQEPIFAANPNKPCSNTYMQCAINTMGIEGNFRYDVIAGGILYCNDTSLAFDTDAQKCRQRHLIDACLNTRKARQANATIGSAENSTMIDEGFAANETVIESVSDNSTMFAVVSFENVTAENSTDLSMRRKRQANATTDAAENSTTINEDFAANETIVQSVSDNSTMYAVVSFENATAENSTDLSVRRKRQANATIDSAENSTMIDEGSAANVTAENSTDLSVRRKRQANATIAEASGSVENSTLVEKEKVNATDAAPSRRKRQAPETTTIAANATTIEAEASTVENANSTIRAWRQATTTDFAAIDLPESDNNATIDSSTQSDM